jgi:type IV secretory pathway TrbF-like protein
MKPSIEGAASPPTAVYAAARQEWLERYGDYVAQPEACAAASLAKRIDAATNTPSARTTRMINIPCRRRS